MNHKKVGWIFLLIIACSVGISFLVTFLYRNYGFELPMLANLFLSEGMIVVPTIIVMLFSRENWIKMLRLKKIKISTALVIILFTLACSPLVSMVNLISQLFVENVVVSSSAEMMAMPVLVMFFMLGINAPVCEEFVFRGSVLTGFGKGGNKVKAILFSGLLFGLMHLNLNQACYAFVIGIILALLVEVTGSIFSSLIFHATVNISNTLLLFITTKISPEAMGQAAQASITKPMLLNYICMFMVLAVGGMAIASCLLVWIAKNENHPQALHEIWESRKIKESKILSIPLVLGILTAIAYIVYLMIR